VTAHSARKQRPKEDLPPDLPPPPSPPHPTSPHPLRHLFARALLARPALDLAAPIALARPPRRCEMRWSSTSDPKPKPNPDQVRDAVVEYL
jgi:hypothetical protein